MSDEEREFWKQTRQALLMQVANIEMRLGLEPRTAERCRAAKALENGDDQQVSDYLRKYGKPERS